MIRRIGQIVGLIVWGLVVVVCVTVLLGVLAVALVSCGGEG